MRATIARALGQFLKNHHLCIDFRKEYAACKIILAEAIGGFIALDQILFDLQQIGNFGTASNSYAGRGRTEISLSDAWKSSQNTPPFLPLEPPFHTQKAASKKITGNNSRVAGREFPLVFLRRVFLGAKLAV